LAVALHLIFATQVSSHGGPPLRIGVTREPATTALGRLLLAHLREGVGFGVDWRAFADEHALRAAFAAGRIDIAVGVTASEGTTAARECPPETLARLLDGLRRLWGGEGFLMGFPRDGASCARNALIVSRVVLEDLRFGILGREAARFSSIVTREDVVAVQAASGRGGERAAAAAARAAMAAKAVR
jgi:hypothetical protein